MRRLLILSILLFLLTACAMAVESTSVPTEIIPSSTATETKVLATVTNTIDPTLDWINEEIDFGEIQIMEIITALKQYHLETGSYPDELEELVPGYIAELPLTLHEKPFDYYLPRIGTERGVSFKLERRNHVTCGYYLHDDRKELWECNFYVDH